MVVYDVLVALRNQKLVEEAARSNAVVTSLFPGAIRDRIMERKGTKLKMKEMLKDGTVIDKVNEPLADLFLNATVSFADIAGFTAWSSVREPNQVFTLLETVYASFDALAKKRRIFKVGTCDIGSAVDMATTSTHLLPI